LIKEIRKQKKTQKE